MIIGLPAWFFVQIEGYKTWISRDLIGFSVYLGQVLLLAEVGLSGG